MFPAWPDAKNFIAYRKTLKESTRAVRVCHPVMGAVVDGNGAPDMFSDLMEMIEAGQDGQARIHSNKAMVRLFVGPCVLFDPTSVLDEKTYMGSSDKLPRIARIKPSRPAKKERMRPRASIHAAGRVSGEMSSMGAVTATPSRAREVGDELGGCKAAWYTTLKPPLCVSSDRHT